ncbi:hypothetical protein PCI56_04690 [Plesiomonas shigelloides subsp. oncorhynchi]|nr:hypothetical protein [Plesiomonas shigelloides]
MPPLANDNPLQGLKDVGGGLGDIDFPFDAFNVSAETTDTDETKPVIPDATALETQEEQQNRTSLHKNKTSRNGMISLRSVILMNLHRG